MPGFLGGSTSGGGTGGEIRFPKEFIDPVTKLRVSEPETLIDTDFEYGLQPTKWETLELINNTPSFFSKSGDTTIPGIVSITTNAGTREITVTTALDHQLAVGIPINVTGTKSITADGAYIINSIPDTTTFTYLCKDNQAETLSIEDLYTSIITGEFFQGSQLRIADAEGITTDGAAVSTLTVTTESAHGFGVNTPFYFLNLNSTVAQEFESANTAAKSFDSSNSATAQTFDGSNTLSQIQIDFSNSATLGGTPSSIIATDAGNDTITVTHTTETFVGSQLGTPLYYEVTTSAGYFASNPRGVVFLKTTNQLSSGTSIFQVSEVPDGDAIDIEASMNGTFQLANQARIFAGNNVDTNTESVITVVRDSAIEFEGANDQAVGGNGDCTVANYSGSLVNVTVSPGDGLDYYQGAMVLYSTDGSAASGLTNDTTYFIDSFFSTGTDTFAFTLKDLPTDQSAISVSGGTGTQTFSRIGVSIDKDIVHVKNSQYSEKDMLEYEFPASGNFGADEEKVFYFVKTVYDAHNYQLNPNPESFIAATGGNVTQTIQDSAGRNYTVHRFTSDGTFTLNVTDAGTFSQDLKFTIEGSGSSFGGATADGTREAAVESITVVVDNGGRVDVAYPQDGLTNDIEFSTINPIPISATGGSISDVTIDDIEYRVHTFTSVGTSNFVVTSTGNLPQQGVEYLIVAGGGAGGNGMGGGGGAGGLIHNVGGTPLTVSAQTYNIVVGAGATGTTSNVRVNGQPSSAFGLTALGGGGGSSLQIQRGGQGLNANNGGSGGGSGASDPGVGLGGTGLQPNSNSGGFGNRGGDQRTSQDNYPGAGGGGANEEGQTITNSGGNGGKGGNGLQVNIDGNNYYWAGGGGGNAYTSQRGGNGGLGGGGAGSVGSTGIAGGIGGGSALNSGENGLRVSDARGGDAGSNTGGGGGGAAWSEGRGGNGGSGIVIIRYPLEPDTGGGGA